MGQHPAIKFMTLNSGRVKFLLLAISPVAMFAFVDQTIGYTDLVLVHKTDVSSSHSEYICPQKLSQHIYSVMWFVLNCSLTFKIILLLFSLQILIYIYYLGKFVHIYGNKQFYSRVRVNDHVRKLVILYFLRQYIEHPIFHSSRRVYYLFLIYFFELFSFYNTPRLKRKRRHLCSFHELYLLRHTSISFTKMDECTT